MDAKSRDTDWISQVPLHLSCQKNVIETEINVQVFITIPLRKVTIEQSNSKL